MNQNIITYQLATHYLIKNALNLECLFLTIEHACHEPHPFIHHYALNHVIEIIKIIEKPELKSRLLKELIRIEHAVQQNKINLTQTLFNRLKQQTHLLSNLSGRFAEGLIQDAFIQNIRLIPQNHANEEIYHPHLLHWLENTTEHRIHMLKWWLSYLTPLKHSLDIYTAIIKSQAKTEQIDLHNGYYHCHLLNKPPCHLIMLSLDKTLPLIPNMQLGHHGLSIRMRQADFQLSKDKPSISATLSLCYL